MNKIIILIFIVLSMVKLAIAQDRDLTGYTLVFSDEFNAVSIGSHRDKGTAKWGDWPPYGPAGGFSFSHWMGSFPWAIPDVANIQSGILRLWMRWYDSLNDSWGRNWISGIICSKDINNNGFAQRFGYWSARIKMPSAGQGAWCAFWLASTSGIPNGGSKGYEIDILEWYGTNTGDTPPDKYGWAIHPWNSDGSQAPYPYEGGSFVDIPGGDAVNTWHVYGCEVNDSEIILYIDGKIVARRPIHPDYIKDPLYIILNYALRNDHPGQPFPTKGSSHMQIDWVRAYSLPNPSFLQPPTFLRIVK